MSTPYKYLLLIFITVLAAGIVIPKAFFRDSVKLDAGYRHCAELGVHEILGTPFERFAVPATGTTIIVGKAQDPDGRLVAKTETYIFFGHHYASTLVSCYKQSDGQVTPGSVSTIRWGRGDGEITSRKY